MYPSSPLISRFGIFIKLMIWCTYTFYYYNTNISNLSIMANILLPYMSHEIYYSIIIVILHYKY